MKTDSSNIMPDLCNRKRPLHFATALNLLLIANVDLHRVNILPVGTYENYKGEILEQEPAPGRPLRPDTKITLKVGFPAAIDKLPYQFFYGLEGRRETGSEWEDRARRLTAMFDTPEIRYSAYFLRQILKFNFSVPDTNQFKRFLSLFALSQGGMEDYREVILWITLLPSFNEWAGNPDRVAEVLGKLFGYRFRIIENMKSEFEIPDAVRYRLGSPTGRLGKEAILGRTFVEYDSAYQVIVSGIPREEIVQFLPGGKMRKKVEAVLQLCMPSNLDYRITFETDAGTMKPDEKSRLGYSARI